MLLLLLLLLLRRLRFCSLLSDAALQCDGLTVGIRSPIDICASVRLLASHSEYSDLRYRQIEMTTSICSTVDQRLNKESDCLV
jgi:hypothetical protein